MSNKKEEIRTNKKLEKKIPEVKERKSTSDSTTKSIGSLRETKLKPILISTIPGDAIMGYVKEEPIPKKLPPLKENIQKNPNSELENRVESSMIMLLEGRCNELSKEIEEEKGKRKEVEVENAILRSNISNLEKDIKDLKSEMNEERIEKSRIEAEMEELKELLNKAKRELGRVNQDARNYLQQKDNLQNNIEDLSHQKLSDKQIYEQEIKILRQNLEEIEEENEDLKTKLQIKSEIDIRMEEERTNYIREIQLKSINEAESKLEKITRLISENATLDEKLKESESLRRKYQDRHSAQEEKIKSLNEQNKSLNEVILGLKKQLSDLKTMRTQTQKLCDEKMHNLTQELDKLKKENESLKKSKGYVTSKLRESEDQVLLEPVEAKPYLFGPVDNGKY